jgi:hypothetical protein
MLWVISAALKLSRVLKRHRAIEAAIGNRRGQRTDLSQELHQNFGEVGRGQTVDVAAKRAGFGNAETYRQAKAVVDTGAPELVAVVDKPAILTARTASVCSSPSSRSAALIPLCSYLLSGGATCTTCRLSSFSSTHREGGQLGSMQVLRDLPHLDEDGVVSQANCRNGRRSQHRAGPTSNDGCAFLRALAHLYEHSRA